MGVEDVRIAVDHGFFALAEIDQGDAEHGRLPPLDRHPARIIAAVAGDGAEAVNPRAAGPPKRFLRRADGQLGAHQGRFLPTRLW